MDEYAALRKEFTKRLQALEEGLGVVLNIVIKQTMVPEIDERVHSSFLYTYPMQRNSVRQLVSYALHVIDLLPMFRIIEEENETVVSGMVDITGGINGRFDGTITITYHPDDHYFYWTPPYTATEDEKKMGIVLMSYVIHQLCDTISHELVHVYQRFRRAHSNTSPIYQRLVSKKEYKCIQVQDEEDTGLYLLNPDEIDAYAYNTASQVYRKFVYYEDAMQALKQKDWYKDSYLESAVFFYKYIDPNSYISKKFMKKVYKWLLWKYTYDDSVK